MTDRIFIYMLFGILVGQNYVRCSDIGRIEARLTVLEMRPAPVPTPPSAPTFDASEDTVDAPTKVPAIDPNLPIEMKP